ncbi:SusD/RagB family nutrient-binding outer membrane lipoprotein [Reichenbachiella carrageenanivorans]|uniref:SusD/RagB family nutrient-binding outer membrane lipoprotein n=1 Tax=Reichenbachiella carrageenanivorans TaxID=2979869 RepID=A0ABY6D122_9BACT|nr:SusD/RagB family nutrient-binding outer membrane lipoprotein [Reichenbachiella carrageenanivorans]UXX79874.1 SusD/RagB family nutrient-binding outer membrane lipoprotein [Reichenbachiella carrageenanivorans]
MERIKYLLLISILFSAFSCTDLVDDINKDLTELDPDAVPPEALLRGAQLSNIMVQQGHALRISALYSGQMVGYAVDYGALYSYNFASTTGNTTWTRAYQGVVPQVRLILSKLGDRNVLLQGISQVLEAHSVGTCASLFGDVPYTQAYNEEIDEPDYESQVSVFQNLQVLLDLAIENFEASFSGVTLAEDIYYGGDRDKWLEAAWTLKARYYMHMKDYESAYAAAQKGIVSAENTMYFTPFGDEDQNGNKNTFYTLMQSTRSGDIGTASSYLMDVLNPSGVNSRNNAKTDERARYEYYKIAPGSTGIADMYEPQRLISYEENILILAEAGTRTIDMATGLAHLNELRAWLNGGEFLNDNFASLSHVYNPYLSTDFLPGGIENADGIAQSRALLREIIEERYVSGFLTYMPFDDARRLRKSDSDIAVAIPLNSPSASQQPERFIYPANEINTNSNIPTPLPDLVLVTEVNK